jgi:hypothetical protein
MAELIYLNCEAFKPEDLLLLRKNLKTLTNGTASLINI